MSVGAHGVSHIGIGVRDLDRSVTFYRDVLGCALIDRYGYDVPADPSLPDFGNSRPDAKWWREVAVLRAGSASGDPVIVMSLDDRGQPAHRVEMDNVGTHHWGMWVTGIEDYAARLAASGAECCVPLRTFDSARAWGLPDGVHMKTCIYRDPDGTMIQLDEVVAPE
jgi:catechol 2,3-dioxygenase-like lactoylglutathione lyase family enzyme